MATRRRLSSSDRLKKHQMAIYIEPEQYDELKALSAETGVPQQVYLRRGLSHVLGIEWERRRREDGVPGRIHVARSKKKEPKK